MIQGLYAAATGIMAIENQQALVANNIANAGTPGFRRQDAVNKGFYEVFLNKLVSPTRLNQEAGPGGGVKVLETFTDTRNGVVTTTGNPLNVALMGPGYIAVETAQGDRFTRNGTLSVDTEGYLVTESGYRVQDVGGGYIDVRGGQVEIDGDGMIRVDGEVTGQIRLVEFEDPHALTREGHDLYAALDETLAAAAPAAETQVIPESLEASNVQLPVEMIKMIVGLRAYSANQRVINSIDETVSKLIEQVGSPV